MVPDKVILFTPMPSERIESERHISLEDVDQIDPTPRPIDISMHSFTLIHSFKHTLTHYNKAGYQKRVVVDQCGSK